MKKHNNKRGEKLNNKLLEKWGYIHPEDEDLQELFGLSSKEKMDKAIKDLEDEEAAAAKSAATDAGTPKADSAATTAPQAKTATTAPQAKTATTAPQAKTATTAPQAKTAPSPSPEPEKGEKDKGFLDKVKGAISKGKRVAQGVADIATGGPTNLGGEEVFDKEKRDKIRDDASNKIKSTISKVNYKPISDLFADLQILGWPNRRPLSSKGKMDKAVKATKDLENDKGAVNEIFGHSKDFQSGVDKINAVYDEIKAEFEKAPSSQALDIANKRIATLRALVLYFQDYVLSDTGNYLKEEEETLGAPEGTKSKNYQSVYSSKLPVGLAVTGGLLAASGLALDSDWAKDLLSAGDKLPKDPGDAANAVKNVFSKGIDFDGNDGLTQALSRASGVNLGPRAPISNFMKPEVQKFLSPDLVKQFAQNPQEMMQGLDYIANNADAGGMSIGQLLGKDGPLHGLTKSNAFAVNQGSFESTVLEPVLKKGASKVAKTMAEKGIGSLKSMIGPTLMGLGLAVAAGGAASGLMRAIGKRRSKMSTMQDVVDSLKDLTWKPAEKDSATLPKAHNVFENEKKNKSSIDESKVLDRWKVLSGIDKQ
jgi:hypothetical protein